MIDGVCEVHSIDFLLPPEFHGRVIAVTVNWDRRTVEVRLPTTTDTKAVFAVSWEREPPR